MENLVISSVLFTQLYFEHFFILTTPSPCIKHFQVANNNQTQSQHINNAFNNTHVQTSCPLTHASDIIFNLVLVKKKMSHPYIQIAKIHSCIKTKI